MKGALARALGPTLLAIVLLAVGVAAGRWSALAPFARQIDDRRLGETLGSTLAALHPAGELPAARRDYASAYLDPERAERELDGYAWDVPTLPTPFLGSAPAPGRHANAIINAQQFRHEGLVLVPRPADAMRVFVVGGSTAFGSGAPSAEATIPGRLAALLGARGRRVEVVNASAPGWASSHERILVETRIAALEPDLVVSLSGNNDVYWGGAGRDVRWLRIQPEQHWFTLLDRLHRAVGAAPLGDVVGDARLRVTPDVVTDNLLANLRQMQRALGSVPLLFALQPTLAVSGKALTPRERAVLERAEGFEPGSTAYFRACYARIRSALESASGLRFVDLSRALDDRPADEEVFLDRFHFGDRGNRLIAAALAEPVAALLAERPVRPDETP